MHLMHFNKYDESTDDYETGEVVNVDIDGEADDGTWQMTIYLANGSWYFTLNESDVQIILDAVRKHGFGK